MCNKTFSLRSYSAEEREGALRGRLEWSLEDGKHGKAATPTGIRRFRRATKYIQVIFVPKEGEKAESDPS